MLLARSVCLSLTASIAMTAAAMAQPAIPDIAQAMLDAAYETGDPAEIAAVARAVKAVFPEYETTIEDQTTARIAKLEPAEPSTGVTDELPVQNGGVLAISPWKGKINAGASFASGNSDNLAASISVDAVREAGNWSHHITGFYDYAESNDVATQNRFGGAYELDYLFNEHIYAYGRVSYEDDAFSGFDYRLFTGAGLGYFLFKSEPFTWSVEGGPGYRYSPIDLTREVEEEFALYGSTSLDWFISEGVVFEQDVNITWTSPTTTIQSITALTTKLTESISTGLSFEYRHETEPPLGRDNTDTIARATLIYGF